MVRIQMISVTSDKIIKVRLREKPTTEDLIQFPEQASKKKLACFFCRG